MSPAVPGTKSQEFTLVTCPLVLSPCPSIQGAQCICSDLTMGQSLLSMHERGQYLLLYYLIHIPSDLEPN